MVIYAFDWVNYPPLFSCSENEEQGVAQTLENVPLPTPPPVPDLNEALSKRIEGKPKEAIKLLRKLNEQFPQSSEVLVQLGRALIDAKEFALAAFRFEQAISKGAANEVIKESAEAHAKSGDIDSSIEHYTQYFSRAVNDPEATLPCKTPCQKGRKTDAINTFLRFLSMLS